MNADDLPDPDDAEFFTRYLEACHRLGVEPVSVERVHELVTTWNATIEATNHSGENGCQRTHWRVVIPI